MEAEEFTSVSTGCFVVKPSKRREPLNLPSLYQEEAKESNLMRHEWYETTKNSLTTVIESVLHTINTTTVGSIINFVKQGIQDKQHLGIYTLTIKVGVNFQEYYPVYEQASKVIGTNFRMKCITISSQSTDVSGLLKDIFAQVLTLGNEEEKILTKTLSMKGLFQYICSQDNCKGLVMCIPRFDAVSSSTIESFVKLCSSSMDGSFPLFLVLGLATGSELSSEWVSSSTISQLKVETMTLMSPTSLLEKVLFKSLLCSNLPFKLSYRAFEVLLSRFSLSNYSLHDVLKTIKVAMLTHCCRQPLVRLVARSCTEIDASDMTDEEKTLLLQLPSMQDYIEKSVVSNKPKALKILEGDNETIENLYLDCQTNYSILHMSFKVLHCLIRNLPGNHLVSKPLELYSFCIQGTISEVKEVCVALKCFGMLQRNSFIERLETAYSEFESFDNPPNKVQLLGKVLRMQIDEMKSEMDSAKEQPVEGENKVPDVTQQKAHSDKLANLQKSFVSRLENYFSTLTAPTSWPMHEILWYTDHTELQNLLVGKCRTALHRGLSAPELYLQSSDLSSRPDLCHLYDLFHEHGRLICLHDWIQSYSSSLDGGKKISNETHARFIRAVSELHFMGYLKPTKRKTDHVAKLSLLGY